MPGNRILRCTKGAAAAELALLLPLMVAILFGMFEGGYFLYNEHKALKGVRDGARYAARQPFSNFPCGSTSITDTALVASIQNVTRTGTPDGSGREYIPGWVNSDIAVSYDCDNGTTTGLYKNITGGAPRVTVSADVGYTPLFGVIGFDTSSLSLKAEAEAAVMGL